MAEHRGRKHHQDRVAETLREEIGGLDAQKLGFAKWLVDQRRVAEN